jgi:hypothetical protein
MSGIEGISEEDLIASYRTVFLRSNAGMVVLQHLLQQLKVLPDQILATDEDVTLHNFGCQLSYYLALDWNELAQYIRSMPTETIEKERE